MSGFLKNIFGNGAADQPRNVSPAAQTTPDNQTAITRLTGIFRKTLRSPDLEIRRETSSFDIRGWTSLVNIQLMVAVEKEFKIKFSAAEISSMKNVGDLLDSIQSKTG